MSIVQPSPDGGPDLESRGSGAAAAQQVRVQAQSLTYKVKVKGKGNKDLTILDDINVTLEPGEMVALLGPSGAGKTSLLNALSGCAPLSSGGVLLNGKPLTVGTFHRLCCYVPQDDILLHTCTPSEVLMYSAQLQLSHLSRTEQRERVAALLEVLSLAACKDTRIGDVIQRGLSGGERKRVSLGMELLSDPCVIYADEPTSGLDSKMAMDVGTIFSALARQKRTIIITIHQPSPELFALFHKIVLLDKGRVVFAGPTADARAYFGGLGFAVPESANLADFLLLTVEKARKAEGTAADALAQHWAAGVAAKAAATACEATGLFGDRPAHGGGCCNLRRVLLEARVLSVRGIVDAFKDPRKFGNSFGMKMGVGVLMGIVYFGQVDSTQGSIFTTVAPMFFLTFSSVMDTLMPSVTVFPQTRALVVREYRNGAYSTLGAFVGQYITLSVVNMISLIGLAVPPYFMIGFGLSAAQFLTYFLALCVLTALGVALGIAVGSRSDTVDDAMKLIMPMLMPLMLFSGFMIPYDRIPLLFQWVYYVSFFQYGLNIMIVNEFDGKVFTDCGKVATSPPSCLNQTCLAAQTGAGSVPPAAMCFQTGADYLDKALELDSNAIASYFLVLLVYALLSVVLAYASFSTRVRALARTA